MTLSIEAILRGEASGPVECADADAQGIAAAASVLGATIVELAGPSSKAEILAALGDGFAFPSWWGRNWDALEELLGANADGSRRGLDVVIWRDPAALAASDPKAWGVAIGVLEASVASRRSAGDAPLIVILTGRQPETVEEPMSHSQHPADAVPASVRSLGKVHHVAVVVRSIEASLTLWRDTLGLPVELVLPIEHDRVTIAFLPVGESKIELVQPDDDTTGVARFLANKGEGFHHVCFEVPDINAALMRLEMDGIELIDTAARKGAEGPVAFLHPRSCQGVLVELIEAPGGPAWAALGY